MVTLLSLKEVGVHVGDRGNGKKAPPENVCFAHFKEKVYDASGWQIYIFMEGCHGS